MTRDLKGRPVWWLPLGVRGYEDVWALQKRLIGHRRRREIPDLFISVEHPHVITAGRGTAPENLFDREAPDGSGPVSVFEIERGGDVTYHGPGQLVGYFIFDLKEDEADLHRFLRKVEAVQIELAAAAGITAGRREGKTGVWAGDRKLGSVGIAVRNWITYHGFALNVATDLRFFQLMNPCGFDAAIMSSLSVCADRAVKVADVSLHVPAALHSTFGRPVVRVGVKRLPPEIA